MMNGELEVKSVPTGTHRYPTTALSTGGHAPEQSQLTSNPLNLDDSTFEDRAAVEHHVPVLLGDVLLLWVPVRPLFTSVIHWPAPLISEEVN
jgi:hypothetical protein